MSNEVINNLIKRYEEGRLSHIFLIETNDKEQILEDLKYLAKVLSCTSKYEQNCKKCNICNLIESNNLPTLETIRSDGQFIKKEQMEKLKIKFSSVPFISQNNVYIILDSEKFNSSSANTILKFIEEPVPKLYGFLVTNNKENVLPTIKSRCEILKINYDNKKINNDYIEESINYLKTIELNIEKSIINNNELINKKYEKEVYITIFKNILEIYQKALNNVEVENMEFLKDIPIKNIVNRINLVTEIIDKLYYNVNINLLLDYFVIEMEKYV